MNSNMRDNQLRAKLAIIMLGIVMLVQVVNIVFHYFQYELLHKANEFGITDEQANSNDTRIQIVIFVYVFILFISGITFIRWFRRAFYNLELKIKNLNFSNGSIVYAWFIPIINLYRPFQIMKEMYLETISLLNKNKIDHNLNLNIVIIWWILWTLTNCLEAFSSISPGETIDELITSTIITIVFGCADIVVAILAIMLIKNYNDIEDKIFNLTEIIVKNEEEDEKSEFENFE